MITNLQINFIKLISLFLNFKDYAFHRNNVIIKRHFLFREKMAFFTRVNLNVPVLPPEEVGTCPAAPHMHRRYASEPVTSIHSAITNSTTRPNSVSDASSAAKSGVVADRSVVTVNANENEIAETNAKNKASVNAKGRPTAAAESSAPSSENGENEVPKSSEKNGNGEPKRYEYVVDRVLGVEV